MINPAEAMHDGSEELWEKVRLSIVQPGGLFYFCIGIIGFPDLTVRTHYGLSRFYEDDFNTAKLVEFPKSHLKSSIGTIGNTLHRFSKKVVLGQDPSDRIAIASNTKTNAKRFLRLLKLIPENNRLFQYFFPELLPEFSNEEVWNQDEIIFPRTGAFTDPSIDTLGVGGAATTRHYTGIIEDDMLAEEDADSPTAIKKAIELHQYYTSLLIDDQSWYLVNEHSWTEYDLNKHIIEREPETAVFSVGASSGFNHHRSRHVPTPIVDMVMKAWSDEESVWPERYNKKALQRRREKAGARIYNAVYENDPFDPDVIDFKEAWLRYYELTAQGDIRILPISRNKTQIIAEMEIVKANSLNILAAYDPALSQKTDAARSALVIVGVDPLERVFILDVMAVRDDPRKLLVEVLKRCVKYRVQQCAIETVLFQKVLYDLVVDECRDWNENHKVEEYVFSGMFREIKPPRGKGDKDARLRAVIGTCFEAGRVYLRHDQTEFIDEYLHFPLGRTRDILDAFTYTSYLWTAGQEEEDVEAYLAAEARYLQARDPVTGY